MAKTYNQKTAMLAITKASLRAIFRSPSAVVFSFVFPLVFILVFGFIGGNNSGPVFRIAIDQNSDTTNIFFDSLRASSNVKIRYYSNDADRETDLVKGRLAGIVKIEKNPDTTSPTKYLIKFNSTTASADLFPQFLGLIESINRKVTNQVLGNRPMLAQLRLDKDSIREVRKYRRIDFILPGQLGFSLLSAGVFGVAFVFFNLRQTLVLKRFFATPIRKTYILLGEALSRVIFQMITAIVILGIGYFFFEFTLVHGWVTLVELLVLSFIGLLIFMGFGFVVSGLAKNESTIPPLANIITLPQFLLAGTFFSIDIFPTWLQPICRALPLTHLNDAMRKVAFEGAHLTDCGKQLGILGIWMVIAYALAIKFFKWE